MKPEDLYIVKENPFEIQKKCQIHAKNIFGAFFVGIMIYYVLIDLIPSILGVVFPKGYLATLVTMRNIPSDVIDLKKVVDTPLVLFLYAFLFSGIFETGKALYALTFIRNRKVEYSALAEGFSVAFKAFLLTIAQGMIIAFWTMFFIIPGIVASYNFRQSYYILADDPSKGVFRILAESKARMLGNRMNLFRLDLSYIVILLVGAIPVYLYQTVDVFKSQPMMNALGGFVISIPLYYAMAIVTMGRTVFYELLLNHGFANFRYKGQDAFRTSIFPDVMNFNRNDDESNKYRADSESTMHNDSTMYNDSDTSNYKDDGIVVIEEDDVEVIDDSASSNDLNIADDSKTTNDSDQQ